MEISLRELNRDYIKNRNQFIASVEELKLELEKGNDLKVFDENIVMGVNIKTTYHRFSKLAELEHWINIDYPTK